MVFIICQQRNQGFARGGFVRIMLQLGVMLNKWMPSKRITAGTGAEPPAVGGYEILEAKLKTPLPLWLRHCYMYIVSMPKLYINSLFKLDLRAKLL